MSAELTLAARVDDATVTRDKTGELAVNYRDAIDVASSDPGLEDLKSDIVDSLNGIESNPERLECNRQLLARFGPIDEMGAESLTEALAIVNGWPGTKVDLVAPKANQHGEIIDVASTSSSISDGMAELREVLDGLPEPQRGNAEEALASAFAGKDFDAEAQLGYLTDWLNVDPDEDEPGQAQMPLTGDSPQPAPQAHTERSTGSTNLPDERVKQITAQVNTWTVDVCKQKLSEWGQPATGSAPAMRARLLMVLLPEVAAGNPAALDLF
jgi:hypothetical protein